MTDPAYDEEVPPIFWRCLLCGEEMEDVEWGLHECDVLPYEVVG